MPNPVCLEGSKFENGCLGKVQHETESAAMAAHDYWVRHGTARSGEGEQPYPCEFCGKWHIGH